MVTQVPNVKKTNPTLSVRGLCNIHLSQTMLSSCLRSILLILLSTLVLGEHDLDYSDLEALGIACPERDRCAGYRYNRDYMDRSCECDPACTAYGDCCIDANLRRASARDVTPTSMVCMHYGFQNHTGVYVVAHCSNGWHGPQQIRQKCEGTKNLSDPMRAAPVINVARSVTYKNLYCAECNHANPESLKTFQFKLACDGLDHLTQEQIMGDLVYNWQRRSWGVNRLNSRGFTNFVECDIIFDVPDYVNSSVRFCRSDLVSRCARNWTRQEVRKKCHEYMAVVFDNEYAYRNPHCAICNHKTLEHIACNRSSLDGRKRPMSFALLLDVNQSDGDQVGMTQVATPECPSGHKYDPFFKRCRKLVCALPGYVVVGGRCTPGPG